MFFWDRGQVSGLDVRRDRFVKGFQLLIGITGLGSALWYVPHLFHHNLLVTLLLFALAVALEAIPVPLGQVISSLLYALPIGALVVYGQSEAVWLMVAASIFGSMLSREKSRWQTVVFNMGQYVLSVLVMARLYEAVVPKPDSSLTWPMFAGLLASAAVFIVVNHLFIQIYQAIRGAFSVHEMFYTLAVDSVYMLLSLPFAFLMVGIASSNQLLALVAILPLVLLAQMLRLHRRTSFIQSIHDATAQLTAEFDIERIAEVAASTAAKLTYANAVMVLALDDEDEALYPILVYPSESEQDFNRDKFYRQSGGVIWQVIDEEGWSYVPDVRKDERVRSDGITPRVPYLSMAIFPMRSRGNPQGALVCYAHGPYAFGELTKEIRTLASQVGVLVDNAKLYQELQRQSWRDAATGLYNYRYFYQELSSRMMTSRYTGEPLSVVVVDIDYFKKFNDTYGHLAGDAVLRSLAVVLTSEAGDGAVVARYGGEEFAMVLPLAPEQALNVVERVRKSISRHVVTFEGLDIHGITVSSGIAGFPQDGDSDRDILLKADSAMYWGAKQRGRNRTAVYTPDFDAQLFVDSLTGLYTYHFVAIRVRESLLQGPQTWGVLCLDMAHFTDVNTAFGFETGNRILQEVSVLIRESVRNQELLCRYGGDQFLVLLRDVSEEEVTSVGGRIDRMISTHHFQSSPNIALALRARYQSRVLTDVDNVETVFVHISKMFSSLKTSVSDARGTG